MLGKSNLKPTKTPSPSLFPFFSLSGRLGQVRGAFSRDDQVNCEDSPTFSPNLVGDDFWQLKRGGSRTKFPPFFQEDEVHYEREGK